MRHSSLNMAASQNHAVPPGLEATSVFLFHQPRQHRLSQATIPATNSGTIGSVWQESTPSKETTEPAQTNTQSTKNHQEGHPLDPNQLTICEDRPTDQNMEA